MKRVIAGIILLVLAFTGVFVYQVNENKKQTELYKEATVFFLEEDYKKAIQLFEEAANHNNIFSGSIKADLFYYQAEAHLKLDEFKEAVGIYDELIQTDPKNQMAYIMKAYCLAASGAEEETLEVYKEGYKQTKEKEFLYYLADQYVTMQRYEEALLVIEDYKGGESEVGQKLAFLEIVIYEQKQDYGKAYEIAKEYCELYPEDEEGRKERDFLETRK